MRQLNAYDLKVFYNGAKGRIIRNLIRQKIIEFWPVVKGQSVMGYGYAMPYLRPYIENASRIFNMMPAQLGMHDWPVDGKNLVCSHIEDALPLETNSVDFVVMIHGLEFLDTPEDTFEEIWRVLKSTGRLLVIVPNRVGLWASADWSPFGQGQPYSARQVEHFLSDNLFVHEKTSHALFSPPFENTFLLRAANFFEAIGPYLYPAFGGVHVIEASKQLYAGKGKTARTTSRVPVKKPVSAKPVATPRQELDN